MTKELWINLPVKDVGRSKAFFREIGFTLHPNHLHNDEMGAIVVGEKTTMVMLFPEEVFAGFTGRPIADTKRGSEVLLSFDAPSREAVDALLVRVEAAGGTVFGRPSDRGWMYGAGFADLDGHRWNVLYMDESRAPKA